MSMDSWTDRWMDGRTDGRTDGWTDGWTEYPLHSIGHRSFGTAAQRQGQMWDVISSNASNHHKCQFSFPLHKCTHPPPSSSSSPSHLLLFRHNNAFFPLAFPGDKKLLREKKVAKAKAFALLLPPKHRKGFVGGHSHRWERSFKSIFKSSFKSSFLRKILPM